METGEDENKNLDVDPPLEFSACVSADVHGFSAKLDSGKVK